MKSALKILYSLLVLVGIVATFRASDLDAFQNAQLARIVFYHLPCALGSSLFLLAAPWYAFRYLRTRKREWDFRAAAAMEMGVVLGILTLVTGSLFAKVQWGDWWSWDPRQTSFLLVMLMAGAYFALRSAFSDPETRAANSGAYVLATLLPVLFLIFVFPRLDQVRSLHPDVIKQGSFSPEYNTIFYSMFTLILIACVWIYRLRVRAGLLEYALETQHAELANRHDSADPRVVRPVRVPGTGGEAS